MYNMLRVLFFCFLGLTLAQAATTSLPTTKANHHHHPKPEGTREPSEHESFRFIYEPRTHNMVLLNNHKCYIYVLTDDERQVVHTDSGIYTLELKLISLLDTATLTPTTKDAMGKSLAHACSSGRTTEFYNVTQ